MYSLRLQIFFAILLTSAGSLFTAYLFPAHTTFAVLLLILSLSVSFGILYFFVYRPLRNLQSAIDAQQHDATTQRIVIDTSDEFLHLSDSVTGMMESFRTDISQMKKLERVRTEFLGNVSHELRTPIFATQGLLETLLNGAIDDKKVNRNFLHKALTNTERLNTLLSELIDISRIESGEMKLRFRFFDVVSFLQQTVSEMQTNAEQRNIKLTLVGKTNSAIDVCGDKERLRQVVVNLIDNAIKYSEPKDTIIVKFEDYPDRVEITVEDTGIGISPQHLPRIFERFYRIDRDRSREMGGTGLGLAIVKHIVEAHDASMKVESEVGVGSKFTFWVNKSAKV